jgi:hypothetical protein
MFLLNWLKRVFAGHAGLGNSPPHPDAESPIGFVEKDFVWQGESLNVSHDDEQPCWLVMVSAPFMVMVHRVFDKEPDSGSLWDVLLEAMQVPQIGDFRRPTILRVKPNQGWECLNPQLQEMGIALETCAELEPVDGWIETVESAWAEWEKHRTKWNVLRRDENGNVVVVETGLSRNDAELAVTVHNGTDEKQRHWAERENVTH